MKTNETIDTRVMGELNGSFDKEFDHEFMVKNGIYTLSQRVAYEIKEKVTETYEMIRHPKKAVSEIYNVAKKEGPAFAAYAVAVEVTEDVIAPAILTAAGHPEYAALLWAIHTEPVMYPLYFGVRKLYRHFKNNAQENVSNMEVA